MRRRSPLSAVSAGAAVLAIAAASPAVAAVGTGKTGPSTTVRPYVLPVADGVETTSLLTVGDRPAGNGYKMVGIPDGLGARNGAAGKLDLFMNHELAGTANSFGPVQGTVRAHGQRGAFISSYSLDKTSLAVETGKDLIDSPNDVTFFNYPTNTYNAPGPNPSMASPMGSTPMFAAQSALFQRFCSSTLTDPGQLFNPLTMKGFTGQMYFANEESGEESRVFGVLDDGTTKQLPRLGLFSWENTVPADNLTDTTLVPGQEDAAAGQLWNYVGTKTNTGDAFDRAGLTNGTNYVADLIDESVSNDAQFRDTYGKGVPVPFNLSEVPFNQPGSAQNSQAAAQGLTLNRIEDGHFDPNNPRDFYFVTTDGGAGTQAGTPSASSRNGGGLWRIRYRDIENPLKGGGTSGTLELLLDGSEAPLLSKPDNITIDTNGNLLIQEDPGNNNAVARIVAYDIDTGRRGVIAQFDPAQFAPGGTGPAATIDEESSGIIDAKDTLGDGEFLFDAQVHKPFPNATTPDPELVEYGQLLHLKVSDFEAVYSGRSSVGTTGPPGQTGPAGQPGQTGPAGPRGLRGRRGRSGRNATVRCTLSRRGRRVTCRVTFPKARRGRLVRAGKTVARGRTGKSGVRRVSNKRVSRGTYRLGVGKKTVRVIVR